MAAATATRAHAAWHAARGEQPQYAEDARHRRPATARAVPDSGGLRSGARAAAASSAKPWCAATAAAHGSTIEAERQRNDDERDHGNCHRVGERRTSEICSNRISMSGTSPSVIAHCARGGGRPSIEPAGRASPTPV